MEEEVKKWLDKKRKEMGQPVYEKVKIPATEPKVEVETVQPLPEHAQEQIEPVIPERPQEVEEEVEEKVQTKHVETQAKIASDMDALKMKDMPMKRSGLFTTRAKIILALIITLVIFIVYWTFVYSPTLLSG